VLSDLAAETKAFHDRTQHAQPRACDTRKVDTGTWNAAGIPERPGSRSPAPKDKRGRMRSFADGGSEEEQHKNTAYLLYKPDRLCCRSTSSKSAEQPPDSYMNDAYTKS